MKSLRQLAQRVGFGARLGPPNSRKFFIGRCLMGLRAWRLLVVFHVLDVVIM